MSDKPSNPSSRAMLIGAIVVIACLLLLLVCLFVGAKIGRFIAAPALVGVLMGLSFMLNGVIDRWRGR
jgi:hypothetical protein